MRVVKRVPVTPSNFAMWRSAIALAHGDHQLSNSEVNLIHEFSHNYGFSDEQQKQLDNDLRGGVDLDTVFAQITEKRDRAHLINFARVLFHIDGEFSKAEEVLWETINQRHMLTIDLQKILRDTKDNCESYKEQERLKRAQEKDNRTWLEKAFDYLTDADEDGDI